MASKGHSVGCFWIQAKLLQMLSASLTLNEIIFSNAVNNPSSIRKHDKSSILNLKKEEA
jgi:hypothetical protein